LFAGAVRLTVGSTLTGVTLFEAAEATLMPMALVALTVKVYAVPLVRPVTMQGDVVQVPEMLELEVAVYEVIAEPPLKAGAVKVTVAWVFPAVAVPMAGASGTSAGITLFEAAEDAPVPTALVALTVKV
jgi:hypothetical protein